MVLRSHPQLHIVRQQVGRHGSHWQDGSISNMSRSARPPIFDNGLAYYGPQTIRSNERRAARACSILQFKSDATLVLSERADSGAQVQRDALAVFICSFHEHPLNVRAIADPIRIPEAIE